MKNIDFRLIWLLVLKDWQVYEKQLAGYVLGLLAALSLVGTAKPWAFNAGALMLIVLLISVGFYAIQSSLITERKEQTAAFIMSLPVSPMDFFWGKLLANVAIYLVPFLLVVGGTASLVLLTALPNGLLVYSLLIFGFMLMSFCVSLSVAIAVESEAWNIFTMMAFMTLLSPFMIWVGGLESVGPYIRTDRIVWSLPVLGLLAAELLMVMAALSWTSWIHSRKTSFL